MPRHDGFAISLVMIAKNEQHNVERALSSAKEIVDEIIVVDTGSTDRTVEIAASLGAKVFHYPWNNDFSAAKNKAIEYASGQWLLLMDADDEIHAEDRDRIRELLQEPGVDCFFFDTHSYFGEGGGLYVRMLQPRLIRKYPDTQYVGKIHESLKYDSARAAYTTIRVNHYGYLNREVESKGKIGRNLSLLQVEMKENPNALQYFYLGTEYLRSGQPEEAMEAFRRSHALYIETGLQPSSEMLKKKIIALQELGRFEEAQVEIKDALQLFPDYTDLLFLRGECLEREGRYGEAIAAYRDCTERGDAPIVYSSMCGSGSYTAWYRIGFLQSKLGNSEKAIDAYLSALTANNAYVPAIHALAEQLVRSRSFDEAADFVQTYFNMNVAAANRYFAEAFANAGHFELALFYLRRLEQMEQIDDEMRVLKGCCQLYRSDRDGARQQLSEVSTESAQFARASFYLCIADWMEGKFENAGDTLALLTEKGFAGCDIDICMAVNRSFQSGLASGPTDLDSRQQEAVFNLCEIFSVLRKPDWIAGLRRWLPERLQSAERILAWTPKLLKHGMATEAGYWLDKLPEETFDAADVMVLRGDVEYALGNYGSARSWYRRALESNPRNMESAIGLSRVARVEFLRIRELRLKKFPQALHSGRISLCMIVRNEERTIARAIDSVKGIVHEIIIADTGSDDETVRIAEERGALVFHYKWDNHFAHARNFAIEQASCEWILVLDADERLAAGENLKMVELVKNNEVDGYYLTIKSNIDHEYTMIDRRLSLFRNKPEYRYVGALHEQIPSRELWDNGKRIEITDCVVIHDGYALDNDGRIKKSERNVSIINAQLMKDPEDLFYRYCLAVELMQREQYGEATRHLEHVCGKWEPSQQQFSDALSKLAQCYLVEKQFGPCEKWLRDGILHFPDYTDLHYYRGVCFLEECKWKEAAASLITCIRLGPPPMHYNSFEGVDSIHALNGLKLAYRRMAEWRIQAAMEILNAGLRRLPDSATLRQKFDQLKGFAWEEMP